MGNTYLRGADLHDMELLFTWANEPSVRRNSVNNHEITWEEHSSWYRGKLESRDCDIFILMLDDTPVGQIRLDYREECGWISFSVDQNYRGQGYGGLLLSLAEEKVKKCKPGLSKLWAVVKKDNAISQRRFVDHDYELLGEVEGNHELLLYQKNMIIGEVDMYIPYGRQWIDEDDIQAVVKTLRSDFLTTGPKVAEFEQMVADYVGAKYAVAISNGTAALHAACYAAGIGAGDEVITTPITFVASANCALYCGATPVFADIDPDTYNIDPKEIRKKITSKTKAIIPVHYTGQPCDMDEIRKIADEFSLIIIEDAAHALGADYKGRKIGSISDMTTFSFHPVKHITTGEGGMIMTDNKELYERLCLFRSHGITRNPDKMSHNEGGWYYQQIDLGYNYRITDIQCALGISQMKKLDKFIQRRREIADRYNKAFENLDGIKIPAQATGCNNSWHLYVIQVLKADRKEVYDGLVARGISVNVHYIPVYMQPYYRQHGYADVVCTNAELAYSRFISLPMYAGLTDEDQEYVISQVKSLI